MLYNYHTVFSDNVSMSAAFMSCFPSLGIAVAFWEGRKGQERERVYCCVEDGVTCVRVTGAPGLSRWLV